MSSGYHSQGEISSGYHSHGEISSGNRAQGEVSSGNRAQGEVSSGNRAQGEVSSGQGQLPLSPPQGATRVARASRSPGGITSGSPTLCGDQGTVMAGGTPSLMCLVNAATEEG